MALGFDVFFDKRYKAQMLGEDLARYLPHQFRTSRRAVILASSAYDQTIFSRHEWSAILAEQLGRSGRRYVMPIQMHSNNRILLDGLSPNIKDIPWSTAEDVALTLSKSLRRMRFIEVDLAAYFNWHYPNAAVPDGIGIQFPGYPAAFTLVRDRTNN